MIRLAPLCAAAASAVLVGGASSSGPPAPGPACKDCPNIVLLLTDDQDELIGGWDDMVSTKRRVQREGVRATEFRIHTPICAPSRAELQSGRYFHNIVSAEETPSPAVSGGAAYQMDLGKVWPHVFPTTLRRERGYVNGLFGKCMNYGCGVNTEGGFNTRPELDLHLMGAFDRWFEGTTYYNGTFFDNRAANCSWPWKAENGCTTTTLAGSREWAGRGDGYATATLGNLTVEWIHEVAGKGRPFFVYYAPHAPHSPATPASWYADDAHCNARIAPRFPNWNYSGTVHSGRECSLAPPSPLAWESEFHDLVSCQPYYDAADARAIDHLAANRCKTLLSVDDSYNGILQALEDTGVAEQTYVLVTSDHGYNLGHHMLPSAKFLLYEHSLRIPMLFRGPGIPRNAAIDTLATQVDLAPTILGLAGVATPAIMDGRSLVANLVTEVGPGAGAAVPGSVARHLAAGGGAEAAVVRTSTFHEYYSQGPWNQTTPDLRPLDDWSNTWMGVTYRGDRGAYKYGVYQPTGKQSHFDNPWMYEMFDLNRDPYELRNIFNESLRHDPSLVAMLNRTAYDWLKCKGSEC